MDGRHSVAIVDVATGALTVVNMPEYFSYFGSALEEGGTQCPFVAVNPATNRIYIMGSQGELVVMDGATNGFSLVCSRECVDPTGGTHFVLGNTMGGLGVAVNTKTNRVYVLGHDLGHDPTHDPTADAIAEIDGATNSVSHIYDVPRPLTCGDLRFDGGLVGIGVNSSTNRIYASVRGTCHFMAVLDGTTGEVTLLRSPATPDHPYGYFIGQTPVVVDSVTNRIFVGGYYHVAVLDGTTGDVSLVALPYSLANGGAAVNPSTNRLYLTNWSNNGIAIVDLSTGILRLAREDLAYGEAAVNPAIDSETNRLYLISKPQSGGMISVIVLDLGSSSVAAGSNVVVQADSASITFGAVTSAGSISVTPILDPATAGPVPGGFAVSNLVAYQITPSSSLIFSGTATTCFQMPTSTDSATFANLRVLHVEYGALVDRTSSQDFATRTLCAATTSFSPFYVARVGNRVNALFEQSRAYHAGSTIPIRVQMLNQAGGNISSSSLVLTARKLTSIGAGSALSVIDSGNANPNSAFRYDSALAGYIFNLSTKGLAAGRYCLSFWTRTDRAFSYNVVFEVR